MCPSQTQSLRSLASTSHQMMELYRLSQGRALRSQYRMETSLHYTIPALIPYNSDKFLHHMCTYATQICNIIYFLSIYTKISHTHTTNPYYMSTAACPHPSTHPKQNNTKQQTGKQAKANKPPLMALSSGQTGAHKQHAGSSML